MTQFPEPLPGISSYLGSIMYNLRPEQKPTMGNGGMAGLPYSIFDKVLIPSSIESGDYLLSWRWDCEQSPQVWQNCADVKIIDSDIVHV